MPEINMLKKELKKLSKEINDIRNKKIATSDMGKRIQYESKIETLEDTIKSLRRKIDEIESDPNYIPIPEKKNFNFVNKLKTIFTQSL